MQNQRLDNTFENEASPEIFGQIIINILIINLGKLYKEKREFLNSEVDQILIAIFGAKLAKRFNSERQHLGNKSIARVVEESVSIAIENSTEILLPDDLAEIVLGTLILEVYKDQNQLQQGDPNVNRVHLSRQDVINQKSALILTDKTLYPNLKFVTIAQERFDTPSIRKIFEDAGIIFAVIPLRARTESTPSEAQLNSFNSKVEFFKNFLDHVNDADFPAELKSYWDWMLEHQDDYLELVYAIEYLTQDEYISMNEFAEQRYNTGGNLQNYINGILALLGYENISEDYAEQKTALINRITREKMQEELVVVEEDTREQTREDNKVNGIKAPIELEEVFIPIWNKLKRITTGELKPTLVRKGQVRLTREDGLRYKTSNPLLECLHMAAVPQVDVESRYQVLMEMYGLANKPPKRGEQIAAEMEISRQRVFQIEKQALESLSLFRRKRSGEG